MVFLMKNTMNKKVEKILLGFASGVMIAASVWSLLIPSINMAEEQGKVAWIPAAIGFLLGIVFLLTLDSLIPHLHLESDKPEGINSKLKKTTMMVLAVTLHNIPEGMAVGVTFAGAIIGDAGITMAGAFALAIGIAIQNFPEGAIISMPLKSEGMSKPKAFLCGTLSGIVEPIGAVITILLTNAVVPILPYLLSFAAGAMIYVVVEELIPESQAGEHSNIGTIGVAIGFAIMMILDVALG
jgi:ZIP family zinc transporter